ncbi:hypothetical protein [Brevibacterium luteolum]|uniref:DUF2975 domain-containing protein n=1 Tax=Brevibacterium luteolum TaxID=199591 RepID=A0A6G8KTW7_9MICO|nr:hypothetical protein [Brevibacterium luteolum]MBM7528463.1 hypothetical protein [Brevibacterium luteolum]MCT1656588.1 hypothetical protein [Brevibacterium luteolum]NNG79332.1 hypothetical protein [Brevibacterium luteolum]QIN28229.1 hypothetical protein EW640_02235 [Brevibacterium luteolum]
MMTAVHPTQTYQPAASNPARGVFSALSATAWIATVPIAAATLAVVAQALAFRPEYPGLSTALDLYAIAFALGGISAVACAAALGIALRACARDRTGSAAAAVRIAALAAAVTTGIVALMLLSAFFVPGGGPLFAPALLCLTLIGTTLTTALRRWARLLHQQAG